MIKQQLKRGSLCLAALLAIAACATKPQPQLGIKWLASCPGRPASALPPSFHARIECGIATVPLDHLDPSRGTLDLDITRVAALQPEQREGAIFISHGGLGAAGDESAVTLAWVWTPSDDEIRGAGYRHLANAYDAIGITPRGAGTSSGSQLICHSDELVVKHNDITEDRSPANVKAIQHNAAVLARGCASQPLAPYINTEQAARDMEFVRVHLNEQKLNFLGYGYGTWLGAWYAGLFPQNVGRMVLDSNIDWTSTFQNASLFQAPMTERFFTPFIEQTAAANPQAYQMGDDPKAVREVFLGLLPEVRAALRTHLYEFRGVEYLMAARALSKWLDEFPGIHDKTLYGKADAYRFSPDSDINEQAQDAFGEILRAVRNPAPWNDMAPGPLSLTPEQSVRSTVICNDSVSAGEAFWIEKENQYAIEYPVGGSFFPARHCAAWPGRQLSGVPFRNLAKVDSLFMVQPGYGEETPLSGIFAAFRRLPNAYMTVLKDAYESDVAFAFQSDNCINDKVVDYLAYGRKPERLTRCGASSESHGWVLRHTPAPRHTRAISAARSRNRRGASLQACSRVIGPLGSAKAASTPWAYICS